MPARIGAGLRRRADPFRFARARLSSGTAPKARRPTVILTRGAEPPGSEVKASSTGHFTPHRPTDQTRFSADPEHRPGHLARLPRDRTRAVPDVSRFRLNPSRFSFDQTRLSVALCRFVRCEPVVFVSPVVSAATRLVGFTTRRWCSASSFICSASSFVSSVSKACPPRHGSVLSRSAAFAQRAAPSVTSAESRAPRPDSFIARPTALPTHVCEWGAQRTDYATGIERLSEHRRSDCGTGDAN